METDLTTKKTNGRLANAEPGSLMERLKNAHEGKGEVLLCDTSGSMSSPVSYNTTEQVRRIDALRDTVHILQQETTPRIVVFNSEPRDTHSIPPHTGGSTNLASALNFLNRDPKPKRIVLISDGQPDNAEMAFQEASKLNVDISAIFIGSPGENGEQFLKDLCSCYNGQFTSDAHALERPKELAEKITGLLSAGNPNEEDGNKTIIL